jgi:hypothetical protein
MRRFILLSVLLVMMLGFAGCNSVSDLDLVWNSISTDLPSEISEDFAVPDISKDYSDVSISWSSDNQDLLNDDGTVTQPLFNQDVTVTFLLDNGQTTLSKTATLTVIGVGAEARIDLAEDALDLSEVTEDLDFSSIEDMYGVIITITSGNTAIIDNNGKVYPDGVDNDCNLTINIADEEDSSTSKTVTLTATVKAISDEEQVEYVLSQITDFSNVSKSLTLITGIDNYLPVITWSSSNQDVLTDSGILTQPVNSVDVNLTATVTLNDVTETKTVTASISGYSDAQKVAAAKEAYVLDVTTVVSDMTFDEEGLYGVAINWTSDSNIISIVDGVGYVTRPGLAEDDASVSLTAEFSLGNAEETSTYTVTVSKYTYTSYTFKAPDATTAFVDDPLNLTGAKLTFVLDDETETEINITLEMLDFESFSITGKHTVTVEYLDITETFDIDVYAQVENTGLELGESLTEDFDDQYNPSLSFDTAQVPNSLVIDESNGALSGNSYYFESSGAYAALFINGGIAYEAGATYKITFDYNVSTMIDTLYFQLNGGASGNLFKQFGSPSQLNSWQKFSYVVTLADTSDYVIQVFPGGGTGTTSMIIDNIKFERISSEPAKTVTGDIEIGDYILETFGDTTNSPFILDLAPTPNSGIIGPEEGSIDGMSLYIESPGSYTGIYLNENFTYSANSTYKVSFDYKVLELADTIYFQLNGGAAGNLFTEFGSVDNLSTVQTFTWNVTLSDTSDYLIQIFPGGTADLTKLVIDNIRIERLTNEPAKTVSGEISEGDYVLDTFGDVDNAPFTLDLVNTPNSEIVSESSLDSSSLYLEIPGNFTSVYLNENFAYTPNATYRITFDYYLTALGDTIYFQLTGSTGNLFSQFGLASELDSVTSFTWEVTIGDTDDYLIQIFPGGSTDITSLYIDNLKVERIG